jgi:hypothetical protein
VSAPVRIPADLDLPDRLVGPLTARQVAILTVTALVRSTAAGPLPGVHRRNELGVLRCA